MKIQTTAYDLAQRFIGTAEVSGSLHNPQIMAMLRLDNDWPTDDSVPWCSAWVNYIAWLLRLPRSKSLAARSWLSVGRPVKVFDAEAENDVVVLSRGPSSPGPEVLDAPGHVGFFAGRENESVLVLGGNQGDTVSVAPFPFQRVLGVRRLL